MPGALQAFTPKRRGHYSATADIFHFPFCHLSFAWAKGKRGGFREPSAGVMITSKEHSLNTPNDKQAANVR